VIFDIGRVLLTYEPQEYLESRFSSEKAGDLLELIYLSDCWRKLDQGLMDFSQAKEAFSGLRPDLSLDVEKLISKESFLELIKPIPESIELLKDLKAKGFRICLLSNFSSEGFGWVQEAYDFWKLADEMIISSKVKLAKPDPAIFSLLLSSLGLEPSECLFIDDTLENVEAAEKLGINGFVFKKASQCAEFCSSILY
jgi:putative hydrolase of the HAD superfamily